MAQQKLAQHRSPQASQAQLSSAQRLANKRSLGTAEHFAALLELGHHSTRVVLHSLRQDVNGPATFSIHAATDLFPHHTSLSIIHIVHFVKHHKFDVSDDVRSLVQHGPQNLCGHDQAGALRLQAHIPSQQACLHTKQQTQLEAMPKNCHDMAQECVRIERMLSQ